MILIAIFGWLILCILIGAVGSNRSIGFLGAFLLSFFLSPIIGLIAILISQSKIDLKHQVDLLEIQTQQKNNLDKLVKQQNTSDLVDELSKLKGLLDSNIIDNDEFQRFRQRTIEKYENTENDVNDSDFKKDPNSLLVKQVDRLFELINEAKHTNLKNIDFLRGAIVTLSLNSKPNDLIEYYNTKYQSDLYSDLKSISSDTKKINYIIKPLADKGFFERV